MRLDEPYFIAQAKEKKPAPERSNTASSSASSILADVEEKSSNPSFLAIRAHSLFL